MEHVGKNYQPSNPRCPVESGSSGQRLRHLRDASRSIVLLLVIPHGASDRLALQACNYATTFCSLLGGSPGTGIPRRRPSSLLALHSSDFLLPSARQTADVIARHTTTGWQIAAASNNYRTQGSECWTKLFDRVLYIGYVCFFTLLIC
jgi:hypothetical protein